MGPRPDGRGRLGGGQSRRTRSSFNGAATGWPRKAAAPVAAAGGDASFNGAATGWPRKVGALGVVAKPLVASMGPRPDGRGREYNAHYYDSADELQWGRDRMAAEG